MKFTQKEIHSIMETFDKVDEIILTELYKFYKNGK